MMWTCENELNAKCAKKRKEDAKSFAILCGVSAAFAVDQYYSANSYYSAA